MSLSDSTYIRRFFSLYSQEEKDKVRGHAFYPTDLTTALLPEGVAHVAVVRSPYPGAEFTKIQAKKAEAMPGVVKVITAKDIPKNLPFGSRANRSQLILADGVTRYEGEPVALVIAETIEQSLAAAKAVEIDWKAMPEEKPEVVESIRFVQGSRSPHKLEELHTTFRFPSLSARYLEVESGYVEYQNDKLTFHIGSLLSESQRVWLSTVLDIPPTSLAARESPLGGQFGGRQQRELIAFLAISAWLCKRSVCLTLRSRDQDTGSYNYHGELKVRFSRETKRLHELEGRIILDAGSYEGSARMALQKALEHAMGPYGFSHIELTGDIMLSRTHPRRALKGEGLTALTWVTEQLVERVAKTLEIHPIEFRLANCREDAERSRDILQEAEKLEKPFKLLTIDRNRPLWDERFIVGRGYAFQVFQPLSEKEFDHSEIEVELQTSGSFVIRTSNLTLDLHVKSALAEVAATVLRTHPKAFTVEGKMRAQFQKSARRETYPEFYYLAQAVWTAASELRQRLLQAGSRALGTKEVNLKDGAVETAQGRKMGYRELAFTVGHSELKVSYTLESVERPHGSSAGAIARVGFHPLTGEIRVESVKVILDAGPVLYKKGLEIEVDTAVSWAMAALFSSETESEQPIPTPMDGPEDVDLIIVDYPLRDYAEQPPEYFGGRGVSSILMATVLGSLVNAIHDAKDMMLEEIPMPLSFMYPKKRVQQANIHMFPGIKR